MDNRGGAREGSGRKPKADEIKLIEALSVYDELAQEKLIAGVKEGSFHFVKLFYEYRYGKPKQQMDITTDGNPLSIPVSTWANDKEEPKV